MPTYRARCHCGLWCDGRRFRGGKVSKWSRPPEKESSPLGSISRLRVQRYRNCPADRFIRIDQELALREGTCGRAPLHACQSRSTISVRERAVAAPALVRIPRRDDRWTIFARDLGS